MSSNLDHAAGSLVLPRYRVPKGVHPELRSPDYGSTKLRAPDRPLQEMPRTLTEVTGPLLGEGQVTESDADLTRQHAGEPIGERIIVHGRVLEEGGRAVANSLVEVWQANAAGRYAHALDEHPAPHDPNFTGVGRCLTDTEGRFRFTTIKPAPYPWRNHSNAWRPAHIHFSLFGRAFTQRLITQMYFPGDPMFFQDPIMLAVRDERARQRMVAEFDYAETVPEWALAYRFDIVLLGADATPLEDTEDEDDDL